MYFAMKSLARGFNLHDRLARFGYNENHRGCTRVLFAATAGGSPPEGNGRIMHLLLLIAILLAACADPTGATADPCATDWQVGTTATGRWEQRDCRTAAYLYDEFHFDVVTVQPFLVRLTSEIPSREHVIAVRRRDGSADYIAFGAHPREYAFSPRASELQLLLEPGSYTLEVRSPGETGEYTLTSEYLSRVACQPTVYATPGVAFTDVLDAKCPIGPRGQSSQDIWLLLRAGERLSVSYSAERYGPMVHVLGPRFTLDGERLPGDPSVFTVAAMGDTARLDFEAPATARYLLMLQGGVPINWSPLTGGTWGSFWLAIDRR
jgi:hypothetical protein